LRAVVAAKPALRRVRQARQDVREPDDRRMRHFARLVRSTIPDDPIIGLPPMADGSARPMPELVLASASYSTSWDTTAFGRPIEAVLHFVNQPAQFATSSLRRTQFDQSSF
jgi:hypothetical protein